MVSLSSIYYFIALYQLETTLLILLLGIYFADAFSLASGYAKVSYVSTETTSTKKTNKPVKKYMFLCEVDLGTSHTGNYNGKGDDALPNSKYQSVSRVHKLPDKSETIHLNNGTKIAIGDFGNKTNSYSSSTFSNNMYVAFNCSQVKIKYLLELRHINLSYYTSKLNIKK